MPDVINFIRNEYKVNFVDLYISDSCLLKCAHCFHGSTKSVDKPLTTSEWKKLIRILISEGILHYHLSGRDPLSMLRTLDILEMLNERRNESNIRFGLITDGIEKKVSIEQVLEFTPDYLEISYDLNLAATNSLRGIIYDNAILGALERLSKSSYSLDKVSLAMVVTQQNCKGLINQITKVYNLGYNRIYLQPVEKVGYARDHADLIISAEQFLLSIRTLFDFLGKENKAIFVNIFIPRNFMKTIKSAFDLLQIKDTIFNQQRIFMFSKAQIAFEFEGLPIQLLNTATITYDGYILKTYKDRESENYTKLAIGNHYEIFNGRSLTEICQNYLITYLASENLKMII